MFVCVCVCIPGNLEKNGLRTVLAPRFLFEAVFLAPCSQECNGFKKSSENTNNGTCA